MWNFESLIDAFARPLQKEDAALREEQAVYGLDSWNESRIQSFLAARLGDCYKVSREVHYPSSAGKKLSHRMRCDLRIAPISFHGPPLWLEIKVAYQFAEGNIRNARYGTQWMHGVARDTRKIETDPLIESAALLFISFNDDPTRASKHLDLLEVVLGDKDVLLGFRHTRQFAVQNRIGHEVCTLALWPTIQRNADSITR
ncbi:MAG: hypothetical protein IT366_19390 [Candidatus Hydrogenedentes bacterium]|nr:hypothetical protein [Candidatus Hydrogenedentota bacterium]